MVLHLVIKTKSTFLPNKLMINQFYYIILPRRKKEFSSFLTISEDHLAGYFFL